MADPVSVLPKQCTEPAKPSETVKVSEETDVSPTLTEDVQAKRRKIESVMENVDIQNSRFFMLRTIIKNLRPYFIEVLHAPDITNCPATHEIRKQINLAMELTKQTEPNTLNSTNEVLLSGESQMMPPPQKHPKENHSEPTVTTKTPGKSQNIEEDLANVKSVELQSKDEKKVAGTYIVGGSPVGWNFIVYPGSQPVYYGETKETWTARQGTKAASS